MSPNKQQATNNVAERAREFANIASPLSKTPKLSDYGSSQKLLQLIDQRFDKQNKLIADQLQDSEERIRVEIGRSVADIKKELCAVTDRVNQLETVAAEINSLKEDINFLKSQMSRQENLTVACDLRINGIPFYEKEDLYELFANLCHTVQIQKPALNNIFRVKNLKNTRGTSLDTVIIVKLASPFEKNNILKSIANFKRNNNDF